MPIAPMLTQRAALVAWSQMLTYPDSDPLLRAFPHIEELVAAAVSKCVHAGLGGKNLQIVILFPMDNVLQWGLLDAILHAIHMRPYDRLYASHQELCQRT